MHEASVPELPAFYAEVTDSSLSRDHITFTLATRIPKEYLARLGTDFTHRLVETLRREFEIVELTEFLNQLEEVSQGD